jgi:chromate transporter
VLASRFEQSEEQRVLETMMIDPADPADVPAPSVAELFLGFSAVAALAFGGVLPWARFVLVERRRWLTPDEFIDMLALCQLLPGPNIINMSVAIGARFQGAVGAIASVLGLLVLPVTVVLLLLSLNARFAAVPAVQGALAGMAAAAAGLVVAMAVKLAEPILRRRFWAAAPIVVLTFIGIGLLRWPLWPVIIVMAPLAATLAWRVR